MRCASLGLSHKASGVHQIKAGRDPRRLAQHDAGRAVFLVAHRDGALHRRRRNTLAGHREVHGDAREDLRIRLGAFGTELDRAAAYIVATALENEHDVVGGAAAGAGQHGLQRPRRQIQAAVVGLGRIGRAVHHERVAAASFRHKAHTGACRQRSGPTDCAFHSAFTSNYKASIVAARWQVRLVPRPTAARRALALIIEAP